MEEFEDAETATTRFRVMNDWSIRGRLSGCGTRRQRTVGPRCVTVSESLSVGTTGVLAFQADRFVSETRLADVRDRVEPE